MLKYGLIQKHKWWSLMYESSDMFSVLNSISNVLNHTNDEIWEIQFSTSALGDLWHASGSPGFQEVLAMLHGGICGWRSREEMNHALVLGVTCSPSFWALLKLAKIETYRAAVCQGYDCEIAIWIDVKKAIEDGVPFFVSILTRSSMHVLRLFGEWQGMDIGQHRGSNDG